MEASVFSSKGGGGSLELVEEKATHGKLWWCKEEPPVASLQRGRLCGFGYLQPKPPVIHKEEKGCATHESSLSY
ncbi:unnamed protein product [Rhodiola kirilowii]